MPGLVLTVSTFTESRCVVSVAAASSFGTRGFASAVRGVAVVCLVVAVSVVTLSCTAGTAGCCGCKRKWLATTHRVVSNDSMKRDSFRMNCVGRGGYNTGVNAGRALRGRLFTARPRGAIRVQTALPSSRKCRRPRVQIFRDF